LIRDGKRGKTGGETGTGSISTLGANRQQGFVTNAKR
jgi:hypothetical protein